MRLFTSISPFRPGGTGVSWPRLASKVTRGAGEHGARGAGEHGARGAGQHGARSAGEQCINKVTEEHCGTSKVQEGDLGARKTGSGKRDFMRGV